MKTLIAEGARFEREEDQRYDGVRYRARVLDRVALQLVAMWLQR
jgi:hypothetical protein